MGSRRQSKAEQSLVVDDKAQPWELDELLERSESEDSDENLPKWKKYAKIILPHVGLIVLSCAYIGAGALVFYYFEKPREMELRDEHLQNVSLRRRQFLEAMWNASLNESITEAEWRNSALAEIDLVTKTLFDAFTSDYITMEVINTNGSASMRWTFVASLFFSTTLLTTIGYGNLVPLTSAGRLFCICYGLFGIPLILITVADLGKFLSEHIIWLYTGYSRAKKRLRRAIRRRLFPHAEAEQHTAQNDNPVADNIDELGLYDYVSIPVTLVLLILVGYTALGALILSSQESWSFFDGFYFSFITMTTVGFGDLVPEKEAYILLDLLYIVVGLAITTMCIDLVGIQYIRKIHYFGRAIQDARFALVNVGGKMVHVGDLVRYAQFLHRKYNPNVIENPMAKYDGSAFVPKDIRYIRYIDHIPGSRECLYSPHSNSSEAVPTVVSSDPGGRSLPTVTVLSNKLAR